MSDWKTICDIRDILPNSGRCALYKGQQVAIFRITSSDNDAFYAVENYDPLSDANVLSRGIVGSVGEKPVVASPVYKQRYCLETGQCLENDAVSLRTWRVRVEGETIQLAG